MPRRARPSPTRRAAPSKAGSSPTLEPQKTQTLDGAGTPAWSQAGPPPRLVGPPATLGAEEAEAAGRRGPAGMAEGGPAPRVSGPPRNIGRETAAADHRRRLAISRPTSREDPLGRDGRGGRLATPRGLGVLAAGPRG